MRPLSDAVLDHLCRVADSPDLSGTKYELVEKIGQGGMACVYRARDRDLDRPVALKVLCDPPSDPQAKSRLVHEARIIARLEHPAIVPVHDAGVLPDGRVYYAMKLVRGQRLDEYVDRSLPQSDLLTIFEKICQAVAFAHAHGVIHRDLKPQNIMVGSFGEVLVMDWGVAKVLGETAMAIASPSTKAPISSVSPRQNTVHGTILGTPGYMAPEQARGDVELVDARTDVYALGAILCFLLTGQPPVPSAREESGRWREPTGMGAPGGQRSSLPRRLDAICRKALAVPQSERYQSVEGLAADIARFQAQRPIEAHQETLFERATRLVVKYRTAIALVLAYLAMRLIFLFLPGPN
jgi:serine/threonine protein kinase